MISACRPTRDFKVGLEHLKTFNFQPEVVLDVGVLTGTPDLYLAFPRSRLILFEPQLEFEPYIKEFAKRYNISYHMVALGSSSGTTTFLANPSDPGAATALAACDQDTASVPRVVPIRRLDEVLSRQDLGNSCLLKIDVEGFELEVLDGAIDLLPGIDAVILEARFIRYRPNQPIFHEVLSWMAEHGFFVHDLLDGGYRPQDGALDVIDVLFISHRLANRVATTWSLGG